MERRKIAIIGANSAITMLINKAKEMGYETHVFAWQCGDPGENAADFFYPISIDNKEKILSICKGLDIAGVCSITSDFAAPTVNYVARKLNLPANPKETELLARDKFEMRKAFKKAGIYTPFFIRLDSNDTEYMDVDIPYPVMVKPTDRWSSKGVTRVERSADLKDAVDFAINESFSNSAIVEGFMDGPEYSAECICYNGKKIILAITKKFTTGYPHYIETGHSQPVRFEPEIYKKVEETVFKGLDALFIKNGAAHAEFRLLPDGNIGLMEIGARMGGDCIGTDLTPISTGLDYMRMVIDISCGTPPCFEKISVPSAVEIHFILNPIDLSRLNELQKTTDTIVRIADIDNDFEREVIDSSTRHGYYIIKTGTLEVERNCNE